MAVRLAPFLHTCIPTADPHASKFTREVLQGLLGIGVLHHQQIIWDKGRTVPTRTHHCYGLELDPKYVDVVVGRWQGFSGEKATLEGDGRTFAASGQDRLKRAA
jgi:hypothetical protein